MSISTHEELFFSPNTELEVTEAQLEIPEPTNRIVVEEELKVPASERFFQSNSFVRSSKISQQVAESPEPHQLLDYTTPKLKQQPFTYGRQVNQHTSYRSNHLQQSNHHSHQQYPKLNPLAEFNLFNLQEVITMMQQSQQSDNQELLLGKLMELHQFNEAALVQQDFDDDQTSPLMERNTIQSHQIKELFEFNQQITQQNTGLKFQIIEVESQLDQTTQKCQYFEETLQLVDQEKQQLSDDLECLYQFLQEQSPSHMSSLESRQSTNDFVITNIQNMVDERNNLRDEVQLLQKNIEIQQANYNQLLQDNQQLSETSSVVKEENDEIQQQFKSLQMQYEEFKLHLQQFQEQNESLEQQNEHLQSIYKVNQEEFLKQSHLNEQQIRDRDMDIYKLTVEIENCSHLVTQKEQIIQNIQEEFQQLLDQAEQSFNSEKHLLRDSLTELQQLQRSTQTELDELTNSKLRLDEDNREFRDRVRQLENQQRLAITQQQSAHEQQINQLQSGRDAAYQKQKQKKQTLEQESFKLNKLNVELQMKLNQLEHERRLLKDQCKDKSFELDSFRSQVQPQLDSLRKQLQTQDQQLQKIKVHENELENQVIFMESEKSDLELLCRRQKKVLNQI